jgi:hypothetical protein
VSVTIIVEQLVGLDNLQGNLSTSREPALVPLRSPAIEPRPPRLEGRLPGMKVRKCICNILMRKTVKIWEKCTTHKTRLILYGKTVLDIKRVSFDKKKLY